MMPIKRSLTLEAMSVKDQTDDEKNALEIQELKKMIEKLQLSQQSIREKLEYMQQDSSHSPR